MAIRLRRRPLVAVAVSLVLALLSAEIGFRLAAPSLDVSLDEMRRASRYLLTGEADFEPHPYEVFVRNRGRSWQALSGLQDEKRGAPKEYPRLLCLGGSTTEGGNSRAFRGAYPFLLGHTLFQEHGIVADVLNGGMSGWCSAESLIAYFLDYQDFEPDVVLIHHAVNDVAPQISPGFRSDYSHWRTPLRRKTVWWIERPLVRWSLLYTYLRRPGRIANSIALATKQLPDDGPNPASQQERSRAFRRNIESIGTHAESRGAVVVLMTMPFFKPDGLDVYGRGILANNEALREIAAAHGWLLVDLERHFVELYSEEERASGFLDSVHLMPAGNLAKAQEIARVLVEAGVVAAEPGTR